MVVPAASEGKGLTGKYRHGVALKLGCVCTPALGGTVCLEHLMFWVSFGCDGSGALPPA